jgi:hypothetical protein
MAMAAAAVAGARVPMRIESLVISQPLPPQRGRQKIFHVYCVLTVFLIAKYGSPPPPLARKRRDGVVFIHF